MWDKQEALDLVHKTGLIPIIRVDSTDVALKVADAFLDGGINIIEVTFSVPDAIKVVEKLSGKLGDKVLIGTGTVLDGATAKRAISAGAEFIVSPLYSKDLIETTNSLEKPCFPGALTPTEITEAFNMGADAVKVFPAGNMGGASYLKAVRAPLPHIPLIPTGGVNLDTAGPLFEAGAFALGVGSAITDKKAIQEGNYDIITENVKKFLKVVKEYR
ncbi:MAG: bifunctional 4-hydroxy-2-oxoglutarate aldolase/2-dehydro-3-deoxy-phosphogluconate aldolase [Candidatus Thorarchaeota archaeon]|nr:bifunctional 4-hydroxy-2-oxoglutarate aldolase/2-dehydro-3-deoxy-phosphogluconate aldolase [Candidatus Thorarchaeota archaeon]